MRTLNVAIVGAGRMGRIRFEACRHLGARVRFICDVDEAAANAVATETDDCWAIRDPNQLDWNKLDAIFICTPPSERGVLEQIAIIRGVHLFVEKPIGLSALELKPIAKSLVNSSVQTAVGYMNRYRASVNRVRNFMRTERPLGIAGHWICGEYKVPWWSDARQSGGPINEQMTHLVDLFRYLIGEIAEVQVLSDCRSSAARRAAVSLKFTGRAMGTIVYSCEGQEKHIGLRVMTDHREHILDGWDFRDETPQPDSDRNHVFRDEVAAFFSDIQHAKLMNVRSTFEDALRTQIVMDAILMSLTSGSSVVVPSE